MRDEPELKRAPETIDCPQCQKISRRQGAQDGCDVYVCAEGHLTRVPVGKHKHKETR